MVGKLLSSHLNALQKGRAGRSRGGQRMSRDKSATANFSLSKWLFRWDSKDGIQMQYTIQMNRWNVIQNTPLKIWHKIQSKADGCRKRTIQMQNVQMQTAFECKLPPCSSRYCHSSSPLWWRNLKPVNLTEVTDITRAALNCLYSINAAHTTYKSHITHTTHTTIIT